MQTARVQLPAVVLQLEASKVLADGAALDTLSQALQGGCNMVVLWDSNANAAAMYDAALRVQEALRARAPLLLVDRTDIALAIGAQGVLLTDQGVPTVVAKRMMPQALVGRVVGDEGAAAAAAADGASLVLVEGAGGAVPAASMLTGAKTGQRSGNAIPVLMSNATAEDYAQAILTRLNRESLLSEEKAKLTEVLAFLEEVLPGVNELGLLRDALKALDEPFLVAVVGEFNSGKSSVINALLGRRYLAEGILPTTNEISILKYSDTAPATSNPSQVQLVQQSDGLYVRYLPAKLLQDLNIVDTPGTNVILERQQRLTEEYVPRADLVLFVMSADRPFSESEVRFLEYIRQWQKKVVFVVNKSDILESSDEVDAVKEFVAANAQRILRLDRPSVIAVSSRSALRAKLTASNLPITASFDSDLPSASPTAPLSNVDPEAMEAALSNSRDWAVSNFSELERNVSNFLVGKGAGGGEGVRLKLQTPLFVADALLGAAGRQLETDLAAARAELEGVQLVGRQLGRFRAEMEKDAAAQRAALQPVLAEVLARAEKFVDSTVQLSNAPLLVSIAAGNKEYPFRAAFEKEVTELSGDRAASGADASSSTSASSPALRAVGDFNLRAISTLLDTELQQAMATTAGTAVGAPVFGLFAMQIVGNTLEDLLLAALAGGVSYVSLLNLPLRRADLKGKIGRVAGNFVSDVQAKMEQEVADEVKATVAAVGELMAPLEQTYGAEVARLEARKSDLVAFGEALQELQRRTANLE
eukprot:XP_001689811.1 predicted protein [Chlamydomonas reinhardtii]